ncbi:MAG: tagatose 1,6-diphosphate aldolase [Deinococcota bacterium]|nr:tagatose 1,6-diphosphate aldolase [Deinococcota bacterium]
MAKTLSAGKLRGVTTLADERGIFKMIAVDQRPPIFRALARHGARSPDEVAYDEVAGVKGLLTEVLAPHCTAVLLDPVWTHPHALTRVPGGVGLLSTLEDHAFVLKAGERWSYPIAGWSAYKAKRSGAAGVKLLVWDRPDSREDTRAHQDAFVFEVGRACREHDLAFVLELLIYPRPGEEEDSPAYAAAKPDGVLDSVAHYSDDTFGVDLLKLEFPADLKHCREFSRGAFDGRERASVYTLDEVREALDELNRLANVPWVLLSAGVGPREFALNLELACEAGASGFLAGRAVWLDALDSYPDLAEMRSRLVNRSLPYLGQIAALAAGAKPWTAHRAFNDLEVAGRGPDWYKSYGDETHAHETHAHETHGDETHGDETHGDKEQA